MAPKRPRKAKKLLKIMIFLILGAFGGCLGPILEGLVFVVEALGDVLEACGSVLEALGGVLEALEGVLLDGVLETLEIVLEVMLDLESLGNSKP